MRFDDDLQQYVVEHNGILFSWDEEPEEYEETVGKLSDAFWDRIDSIARYISADIEEMYGAHSIEEIKEKLGMPNIDPDRGEVNWLEHTFDGIENEWRLSEEEIWYQRIAEEIDRLEKHR